MIVIFNNDTNNPVPISEYTYDYLSSICHIGGGSGENEWDNNVISYLVSIKNTPITSIAIKQDQTTLRLYSNLNGHFVIFNDSLMLSDDNNVVSNVYIDVALG